MEKQFGELITGSPLDQHFLIGLHFFAADSAVGDLEVFWPIAEAKIHFFGGWDGKQMGKAKAPNSPNQPNNKKDADRFCDVKSMGQLPVAFADIQDRSLTAWIDSWCQGVKDIKNEQQKFVRMNNKWYNVELGDLY